MRPYPAAPLPTPSVGRGDVPHRTGCVVCGADLVYLPASEAMTCALCGGARDSAARCTAGHFVCDGCHAAPAKDVIERTCAATDERDPIALAVRLMRHPALKLHGPEHHFLVPAALLASYWNVRGESGRKADSVREARRRSDPVSGGFCGLQGACGAGIGTGTFVALATGATPLDGPARGLANRMTALALDVISRTDGPRCCKRDSFLAILAAARFARERLGVALPVRGPACEWAASNRECLADACPFHPRPVR